MKKYQELNLSDRHEISILSKKGYSFRQIAPELNRSPNTISYEIKKIFFTKQSLTHEKISCVKLCFVKNIFVLTLHV